MGAHYTYKRPIKPHQSTRVYENRAESGYVNRNACFYDAPATRSSFENPKGDTVKIPVSRHTCRRKKPSSRGKRVPAQHPFFSRWYVASPAGNFFSPFFFYQDFATQNDRRIRLIGHLMPELGVPVSAYFMNRFLRAVTPIVIRTYLLARQFFRSWFFNEIASQSYFRYIPLNSIYNCNYNYYRIRNVNKLGRILSVLILFSRIGNHRSLSNV